MQLLFLNYFCLGLDMRVAEVVEADMLAPGPLQNGGQVFADGGGVCFEHPHISPISAQLKSYSA